MNIQAQKAIIIEQFKQINDINLLNEIKKLLESALKKDQESLDIQDNHQKLVLERFDTVRKNPAMLLDWEEAKKSHKNLMKHLNSCFHIFFQWPYLSNQYLSYIIVLNSSLNKFNIYGSNNTNGT